MSTPILTTYLLIGNSGPDGRYAPVKDIRKRTFPTQFFIVSSTEKMPEWHHSLFKNWHLLRCHRPLIVAPRAIFCHYGSSCLLNHHDPILVQPKRLPKHGPLPGLYFVEIVSLSSISAFLFVRGDPRDTFITWGAAGVISAFSILGALSVGSFYLPVALIFAVISITSDVRNKQDITAHLGIFVIAGIAQLALMLTAIRLLDPSAVF